MAHAIGLHLELTDVPELLASSLKPLVEDAASHRIELRVATLGAVPRVRIDREKIAWSVATLVGNALRYIERGGDIGGSVLVHVHREEKAANRISISVQDDGPGIPADKLRFLFERRPGAAHADGLALILVREIVEAHRGSFEVESRRDADDHGTSVTLHLRAD